MSGKQKQRRARPKRKQPYRAPKLVVHGDLRAVTLAKAGNKADGSLKPATRVSGPPA